MGHEVFNTTQPMYCSVSIWHSISATHHQNIQPFGTEQNSTVQLSTQQHSTIQYDTDNRCTVGYMAQCCVPQLDHYGAIQNCKEQYRIVRHHIQHSAAQCIV